LTRWRAARAVVLVLAVGVTGCATKGDIRDVREDLGRLEERQDSIFRLLQMQNREILDSLTVTTERLLNVRGELANELTQLRDQLVQVGELTGQVQIRLNRLDQELATALRQIAAGAAPPGPDTVSVPGGGAPGTGVVTQAYEAGLEQLDRGNSATARRAFRMVVDSFPEHPIAPEAQRQIGETFAVEGLYDEALQAFEAVVERYQNSDAAPRALYRAGVIARERGQLDRAREYFRRLVSAYPDSDASRAAEQALERMGGGE
jgi:tol-pal system protein YbgF